MSNKGDTLSRWQLLSIGFLSLLSPIIRLVPTQAVRAAGPFAWISALLSIIPVGLLFLLANRFFKNAAPSEGFGELIIRAVGPVIGRIVLCLFALWLIYYSSFALRSGADRYVASIYQNSSPVIFITIMLGMAHISALGIFRALGRAAEVFLPLLVVVLGLIFIFSFGDVDMRALPPPALDDVPAILKGVPIISIVMSVSLYVGFLEGRIRNNAARLKTISLWALLMTLTVALLCTVTVGCFGYELTSSFNYPFFVMVRNISVFDFLERLEAIVMALWVITDYMLISILLRVLCTIVRIVIGMPPEEGSARFTDFKNGRWITWLISLAVLITAIIPKQNSFALANLSRHVVPFINLCFNFGLFPLVVFIGLLRKRV